MKFTAKIEVDFDEKKAIAKITIDELMYLKSYDEYWFKSLFNHPDKQAFVRMLIKESILSNMQTVFEAYKQKNINPPKPS